MKKSHVLILLIVTNLITGYCSIVTASRMATASFVKAITEREIAQRGGRQ